MNVIKPLELQKILAAAPETLLLDVRTPAEYALIHIEQARNQPLGSLRPEEWAHVERIYFVCLTGIRAAKAAERLNGRGIVVEGGPEDWQKAGLSIVRRPGKSLSLERQVRIAAGSLVLTGALLAWLVHPGFIGLCALVGTGLVFAGVSGWCGMALLLARLPWNTRPACSER